MVAPLHGAGLPAPDRDGTIRLTEIPEGQATAGQDAGSGITSVVSLAFDAPHCICCIFFRSYSDNFPRLKWTVPVPLARRLQAACQSIQEPVRSGSYLVRQIVFNV